MTTDLVPENSGNGSQSIRGSAEWPNIDLSLSLLTLFDLMVCSPHMFPQLVGTEIHYRQMQALRDLWESFGRPVTGFWPQVRIDVNSIHRPA